MGFENILSKISKTSISGISTAATAIGTTENGSQKFHPMFAVFVVRTANTITLAPTVSIGTNASTYNNILPAAVLTGLTAAALTLILPITVASSNVSSNTQVFINVTAGTAVAMTFDVHLFGFYQ